MSSIKAIKNRLKSVKSTQKITSAMKLVASIKSKKAERAVIDSKAAVAHLSSSLAAMAKNIDKSMRLPTFFIHQPGLLVKKIMMIVYSSGKGMCGGFNVNTAKQCRKKIAEISDNGRAVEAIVIGSKVKAALSKLISPENLTIETAPDDASAPGFFAGLAERVFLRFMAGDVQEVILVYNEFVSAVKCEVMFKSVLPVYGDGVSLGCEKVTEFDDVDADLLALARYNLNMWLYHAFLESAASEHSSRMLAMDSANRNADEMIKKLTLDYNQTRQSAITNELVEIISGADAI